MYGLGGGCSRFDFLVLKSLDRAERALLGSAWAQLREPTVQATMRLASTLLQDARMKRRKVLWVFSTRHKRNDDYDTGVFIVQHDSKERTEKERDNILFSALPC